jgi:putative peptide zinc metalloprotease protein
MATSNLPTGFWQRIVELVSLTAYRPERSDNVVAARLQTRAGPYYVLKQPATQAYLRLSEQDYALWWQMDGTRTIKDLLLYSLRRYRNLPVGHLTRLVGDLRDGHFLTDPPTHLYNQVEQALAHRSPSKRGRQIIDGFFHTEVAIDGLDDFFTGLYRWTTHLFSRPVQLFFLLIILWGGFHFGRLVYEQQFTLTGQGGWTIPLLILANLIVITIHELGHGLMTKRIGRELNRGGFLIYWGMPAFFVDTRDTWLSPPRDRILVSWAGPHTGLILGGLIGLVLALVDSYGATAVSGTLWATFLYQVGFLAFLSVFVNLNPLLELDGYFILMDWLDMPGLRRRAFHFWRYDVWGKLAQTPQPLVLWRQLRQSERVFAFYGLLAFVYSIYAIWLVGYFWQSRLGPVVVDLWQLYGMWGQLLVLLITAVLILPAAYYLLLYAWSYVRAGLDWLARHDLLARPDVLALLIGLPLLLGLPALLLFLLQLPYSYIWLDFFIWLLHLAAAAALLGVARQLPGSRFQWVIWSLAAVPLLLALVWLSNRLAEPLLGTVLWRDLVLLVAIGPVLAASLVAIFTIKPSHFSWVEQAIMLAFGLLGLGMLLGLWQATGWTAFSHSMGEANGRFWTGALTILITFLSLIIFTPLLVNFGRSRFALPWLLLVAAIATLPWLSHMPDLHIPVLTLWLYAGLLYLLLGALARFARYQEEVDRAAAYQERERLINAFNHFLLAMFTSYETVFGGRRLAAIQAEVQILGTVGPTDSVLEIGRRCQRALLLAVDRLDDLAGTPFTRRVGQVAYDSLPWLEAETLTRYVLSQLVWGRSLAQRFARERDQRVLLIRQADIFAGFDRQAVEDVMAILREVRLRKGQPIAEMDTEADCFYLIVRGEVGVFEAGLQTAVLTEGGYFGINALLDSGGYEATYRAETAVTLLAIDRGRFDPLLRADTTLASQVSVGAAERRLMQQMSLFRSLSPQQLATIDARLQRRYYQPDQIIVQQGQPRDYLYIIAEGQVEAIYEDKDGPHSLGTLGKGEHFGEYALFADTPYHATYRAVNQVALLLLDEPKFDALVEGCDRMSHYVEQIGSGRLIATRRRVGLAGMLS